MKSRPKRTTFFRLFAKGAVRAVMVAGIGSAVIFHNLTQYIQNEAQKSLLTVHGQLITTIQEKADTSHIGAMLSAYTHGEVNMFDNGFTPNYEIVGNLSENCYVASALYQENGTMLCNSEERFISIVHIG